MVKMILYEKLGMLFYGVQYSSGSMACFKQAQLAYYFWLLISCRLILVRLEQRREIRA